MAWTSGKPIWTPDGACAGHWPLAGEAVGALQPQLGNATDLPMVYGMRLLDAAQNEKVRAGVAAALVQLWGGEGHGPVSPSAIDRALATSPLEAFRFGGICTRHARYLESFWWPAVDTALRRGGSIHLHTGNFCFHKHFRDLSIIVIATDRKPEVSHADHVRSSLRALFAAARFDHLSAAAPDGPEPIASLSCAEVYDAMEGRSSVRIQLADAAHYSPAGGARRSQPGLGVIFSDGTRSVDAREFRRLYEAACALSRAPENLEHLRTTGHFTRPARQAVKQLQMLAHGTPSALPTSAELRLDDALRTATDRSRWGLGNV